MSLLVANFYGNKNYLGFRYVFMTKGCFKIKPPWPFFENCVRFKIKPPPKGGFILNRTQFGVSSLNCVWFKIKPPSRWGFISNHTQFSAPSLNCVWFKIKPPSRWGFILNHLGGFYCETPVLLMANPSTNQKGAVNFPPFCYPHGSDQKRFKQKEAKIYQGNKPRRFVNG